MDLCINMYVVLIQRSMSQSANRKHYQRTETVSYHSTAAHPIRKQQITRTELCIQRSAERRGGVFSVSRVLHAIADSERRNSVGRKVRQIFSGEPSISVPPSTNVSVKLIFDLRT